MECAVSVSVSVSAGERCGMQPWVRPVAAPPPNPLASAGFCLPCVCVCVCVYCIGVGVCMYGTSTGTATCRRRRCSNGMSR